MEKDLDEIIKLENDIERDKIEINSKLLEALTEQNKILKQISGELFEIKNRIK